MNIGKVINSVLISDGDVSALVSTRVFPMYAKQGSEYPLITYKIDNGVDPKETKDAASTLDFVPIVVGCFAETYIEVCDLAEKTRAALDRYSGTVDGITISNTVFDDYEDDYSENTNEYWAIMDFTMAVKR